MTDIASLIEDSGAVKRGKFSLSDGSLSDYYVDKYVFETHPELLDPIVDELAARLADVDVVAGPELGAVPLVTAVSLRTGVRAAYIRRGETHQGTQARIEGGIEKGQRVAVVEDVSMTGATLLETIDLIEESGGTVAQVLVVVDREEGATEALGAAGYDLEALVNVGDDMSVD